MRLLAPLIVLALLAGCGDHPPEVVEGGTIRLTVRAYRYDHQRVEATAAS